MQRFTSARERALGKLPVEEEGALDGLAADLAGRVWVYRGEEEGTGMVEGFTDASPPVLVEPVLKKTYTYADFYYYYEPCVIATEKVKGNYYGGWFCENEEGAFEEFETLAIIK